MWRTRVCYFSRSLGYIRRGWITNAVYLMAELLNDDSRHFPVTIFPFLGLFGGDGVVFVENDHLVEA